MPLLALILAALAGAVTQPATRPAEPLNLLFFGNSFTMQDDVAGKVALLAEADGHARPNVVADLSGGKDLDYHRGEVAANPQDNVAALPDGATWDVVVVQGYSTEATEVANSHGEFAADAVALVEAVHASGKGASARPVLYQTWARHAEHEFYPDRWPSPAAMQADVRGGYEAAQAEIDEAIIAPVGDAFGLLAFDRALYDDDRYHASVEGSLLASLVVYCTIYDEDVGDIAYADVEAFAGVSEERWDVLVAAADSVASDRARSE